MGALLLLAIGQDSSEVEALIRKLGASDIAEREAASKALVERGQSVRPFLDEAVRGPDVELAARVKAILALLDRHIDALAIVLERIRKDAGDSYQRMLRDSAHALRIACEGWDLEVISASLEKQGLTARVREYVHHEVKEYLAKAGAYVSPSGIRHDLVLKIETGPRTSKTEPTKTVIKGTSIVLVARPLIDFAAAASMPYPDKTILRLAFEHEATLAAAQSYPILQEIEVKYVLRPFSHRDDELSWGFYVTFRLATRANTAGQDWTYWAVSGFDPPETRAGERQDSGFVSADTLASFEGSQVSGWQKGTGQMSRALNRVKNGEEEAKRESAKPAEVRSAGDVKALPETTASIWVRDSEFLPEDCAELIRFTGLRSLEWSGRQPIIISQSAYEHFAKLKTLEEIELVSHGEPSDECLRLLSGLSKLKKIKLTSTAQVTDAGVAHLAGLPELTELSLWWPEGLTDDSLKRLGEHKKLETLHLWGSKRMTDQGLEALSKSKTLKTLTLSHSRAITNRGWAHLEKLTSLQSLTLGCTSLDDSGLAAIGRIQGLEDLSFEYLRELTDAGLVQLRGLKQLRRLHLFDCPGISAEGLKKLQSALPGKYKLD
ncbi:MAG TPA: hypothetical protein VFS19_00155 [Planctomycetota bacterium]|nr:hypothetical protein [Planctomycetota bacterium]